MVLAIIQRSIALRWLTPRKSPGKFCRHAAVSALSPNATCPAFIKFMHKNQVLNRHALHGMALA
jgi:hypothetical protein